MNELQAWQIEARREKSARKSAEQLLEQKAAELYEANLSLKKMTEDLADARALSEQRFADISQAAGEFLWEADLEGRYTFLTSRVEQILKRPREKLLGYEMSHWTSELEAERINEWYRVQCASGHAFKDMQCYGLLPDGNRVWLRISGVPVHDQDGNLTGFRGACLDVSREHVAMDQLKTNEERLRLAMEVSQDGLWDWRIDADHLILNHRWTELLGMPEGSVHSQADWEALIHTDDRQGVQAAMGAHLMNAARHYQCLYRIRCRDGRWKWFQDRGQVVERSDSGQPQRMIGTSRDVTDEVVSKEKLKQAKHQAEKANQAKSDFLARISHEIRTPMNAIMGYADLLSMEGQINAESGRHVDCIHQNASHLLSLINSILDMSKIEADAVNVHKTEVEIAALIETIKNTVGLQANQKGLSLSIDLDERLPESVKTDELLVRQILLNLLSNAIKYTAKGKIRLKIVMKDQGRGPYIAFEVRDSGAGIPGDQLQSMFKKFSRMQRDIIAAVEGCGLGLTIAQRYAELLGGSLTAQSEEGVGSRFTLALPLGPSMKQTGERVKPIIQDTVPQKVLERPNDFSSLRILVIDDHEENRKILNYLLKHTQAKVDLFERADLAIEQIKTQSLAVPDLILMDMHMPVMDGYRATKLLRKMGYQGPIVAITAYALVDDRSKCIAAGCDDYLAKPISSEKLFAMIKKHCNIKGDEDKAVCTDRPQSQIDVVKPQRDLGDTHVLPAIVEDQPAVSHLAEVTGTKSIHKDEVEAVIHSSMASMDGFEALLISYVQSIVESHRGIESAWAIKDYEAVRSIVHKLAGTGSSYGYEDLSHRCRALDELLREQLPHLHGQSLESATQQVMGLLKYLSAIEAGMKMHA